MTINLTKTAIFITGNKRINIVTYKHFRPTSNSFVKWSLDRNNKKKHILNCKVRENILYSLNTRTSIMNSVCVRYRGVTTCTHSHVSGRHASRLMDASVAWRNCKRSRCRWLLLLVVNRGAAFLLGNNHLVEQKGIKSIYKEKQYNFCINKYISFSLVNGIYNLQTPTAYCNIRVGNWSYCLRRTYVWCKNLSILK